MSDLDVKPLILPALAEYRRVQAARRATAFIELTDRVCGIECQPLTPRTYSMLFATGSRFIFGGTSVEKDVKQYLWFHSSLWCDDGHADMRARYKQAMRFFNRLLVGRRGWTFRKVTIDEAAAVLAIAGTDIEALVSQAFADAPVGSGKPGRPVATLEAQLVHQFAQEYRWPQEQTSNTALRRLFQLHRCIRSARGDDMDDEGEDQIKAAHYAQRNAAALAAEKAQPE